jgi:hypothetical protein
MKAITEVPAELEISRNDTIWKLIKTTVKRGPNEGQPYWTPEEPTDKTLPTYIQWAGAEDLCSILAAKDKQMSQNIMAQVLSEDGEEINEELLISSHAERSARGETKGALLEAQAEINAKIQDLMKAMNSEAATQEQIKVLLAEGMKLTMKSQKLQVAIDSKTRERKTKPPTTGEGEGEEEQ